MAKYSLIVDGGGNITGWHSGPYVPAGNVEVSAATKEVYLKSSNRMGGDGRTDRPQLVEGSVIEPVDNRPLFEVTTNKADDPDLKMPIIAADGIDSIEVTIKRVRPDGGVVTAFNGTRSFVIGGRTFTFPFENGAASKIIKSSVGGDFVARSDGTRKFRRELRFRAAE